MALDALAIRRLCAELADAVTDARIDKIHQPERDEIVIHVRGFSQNLRLVVSASASHPRIHITDVKKSNPSSPPMFCMLLRKHLSGGKIIGVRQQDFERVVIIDIEGHDELGELTVKHLITEIMGRHSNIILTDDSGRIIDSIRHVDFTVSSVREILPGGQYLPPPAQDKLPLIDAVSVVSFDTPNMGVRADKLIMSKICGISPLTAREMVYRAYSSADITAAEAMERGISRLENAVTSFALKAAGDFFDPCMIVEKSSGRIIDFSSVDIKQYGNGANIIKYDSMNALLDAFYSGRDAAERMKQKSAGLVKLLNTSLDRASKKLVIQRQALADAENKEELKIKGDLITANLYRIKQGESFAEVENYYIDGSPAISLPLDPRLNPSQNAQKYYKRYQKAKTAEIEVSRQIKETLESIDYLESTLSAVDTAESESDLNQIRAELADVGYIKRTADKKKRAPSQQSKPIHFLSADGFDIYVGRNNTQNDYLTLKYANSQDLWFHTKGIHGSHVIIKLGLDKNVPKETMRMAAELAAYYSKGRESAQVPVDYTQVKNVRKPNGAKPGMVIYDHYNTVYVTPRDFKRCEQ